MINLFIIDDQITTALGLEAMFGKYTDDIKVIGSAYNVPESLCQIRSSNTNIIILDLLIRHDNPVENLRMLKTEFPSVPVIILSVDSSIENQVKMFKEGAKAYVNKNQNEDLIMVIREVNSGNSVIPDEIMNVTNLAGMIGNRNQIDPDKKEVTQYLCNGLTIQDIADKMFKTKSWVEKVLSDLRDEFHAKTNCELVAILLRIKAFC